MSPFAATISHHRRAATQNILAEAQSPQRKPTRKLSRGACSLRALCLCEKSWVSATWRPCGRRVTRQNFSWSRRGRKEERAGVVVPQFLEQMFSLVRNCTTSLGALSLAGDDYVLQLLRGTTSSGSEVLRYVREGGEPIAGSRRLTFDGTRARACPEVRDTLAGVLRHSFTARRRAPSGRETDGILRILLV
jgi:hypothetical protein